MQHRDRADNYAANEHHGKQVDGHADQHENRPDGVPGQANDQRPAPTEGRPPHQGVGEMLAPDEDRSADGAEQQKMHHEPVGSQKALMRQYDDAEHGKPADDHCVGLQAPGTCRPLRWSAGTRCGGRARGR
ncbi:hypothetical protein E3O06_02635 [Cryobacterium glaciale]|uniref:Uncharacterized protein n=1 Tax=Cryobacterium glaciale TaxID=1259145 RepID=A0A4R8V4Y8_9MICO|nr:hypothetical protein E3O06_02635 [Cryobacterium glaciale]